MMVIFHETNKMLFIVLLPRFHYNGNKHANKIWFYDRNKQQSNWFNLTIFGSWSTIETQIGLAQISLNVTWLENGHNNKNFKIQIRIESTIDLQQMTFIQACWRTPKQHSNASQSVCSNRTIHSNQVFYCIQTHLNTCWPFCSKTWDILMAKIIY